MNEVYTTLNLNVLGFIVQVNTSIESYKNGEVDCFSRIAISNTPQFGGYVFGSILSSELGFSGIE